MSERSPEYLSGYQAGFVDGYFTDSEQIAPYLLILRDLIAESRLWLTGDNPIPLGLVLDRAEARLREVTGGDA